MKRFYVTTPIYYVNDLPHIGHIYTTVVGDTVARYRRLVGDQVYFLTGTDEHGQNIVRAAEREAVEPLELANRVVSRYHELWEELAISHDDFIRTSEARHRDGVIALIRRIQTNGDLYLDRHEGWYCSSCESFYTEKELGPNKVCPVHRTPAEWQSEENIFFRLSRYQQPLLDWYDAHPDFVQPASRANEVHSFVESGLKDLSVSRTNLRWGIDFPDTPQHTVYVWLDALTNYISALGFGQNAGVDLYETFWQDRDGVRLHLVGKDILRFHAIYWPAFLLSAKVPLPTTVWAHGWWLRDEHKMSKSVGNVVRPDELIASFGSDSLRYFLLREMAFGLDANFSDEAFIDRYNSDLANDLGNTVSRLVKLSRQTFGGRTPPQKCSENPLLQLSREAVQAYRQEMDALAFHRALEGLWKLLAKTNQYLVSREPWKLARTEGGSQRVSRILWNGLEAVRIVATGLLPSMPRVAAQILAAVGSREVPTGLEALDWGGTPTDAELAEAHPIFPRIDKQAYLQEGDGGATAGRGGQRNGE